MSNAITATGGVAFPVSSVLGIVFVSLKLTHYIDWSWWWVLAPFWIPWAIGLGALAVIGAAWIFVLLISALVVTFSRRKYRR